MPGCNTVLLCFTLSGLHGIYRGVWGGDREVTAWVHNRDRTPLPPQRRRERSPLARRRDASERTIPHVPPSLSSRPRVGEPLSSDNAPSQVSWWTSFIWWCTSSSWRTSIPWQFTKGPTFATARCGECHSVEGRIRSTGVPRILPGFGYWRPQTAPLESHSDHRMTVSTKKYWKLVNLVKNFAAEHYTNDSLWDDQTINWESREWNFSFGRS